MPAGPPLVVAGYFPPPFTGQAVATERLASLLASARDVRRISLQNARGLALTPDAPPTFAAGMSYVRAAREWRRVLRSLPAAPVLWASVSPQPAGHLRDRTLVLPAFAPSQRVYAVVHWGKFHVLGTQPLLRRSVEALIRRVTAFVFTDAVLADHCAGFIPPEKRCVVPNTVGDDVIATDFELNAKRSSRVAASPARPLRVLFLGNMLSSKGYADVLDATALLHRRGVPVQTTFAGGWTGNGAARTFEERMSAHGLGPDVVAHVGPVADRDAVRRLLLDADVLAFPTFYDSEAQPLVVLEAFACGTPVVTTRQGGIPGMVTDGVEGLLVPPRSPEAVADALGRLADPGFWRAASEAARARFDAQFSPDAVRARWLGLLGERARPS